MAISIIVGKVDGAEIIFRKDSNGSWNATVPRDLDGEYIVEVKAYDEAGNQAYSASMLFIVDPATLQVNMIPLNFAYRFLDEKFNEKMIVSEFAYREVKSDFDFKKVESNFIFKVVS